MAITFGPLMVFPDSFDRDALDFDPRDDEDFDPRDDGVYPFTDEDGVTVIDPREGKDESYADYLTEMAHTPVPASIPTLDEDWVLNMRGAWS